MVQPQRPGPPVRSVSASSFAETFNAARHKLDKNLAQLEEASSPETEHTTPLPGLTSSGESTPKSVGTPLSGPITPEGDDIENVADDFAFAFDIDGVLVRGGRPIPEAIEAMKMLNGENEYNIRV